MTLAEFATERETRPCVECGSTGLSTELNPNNNGLQVVCPSCSSRRPWGTLLYLKQNERRRTRPPLPEGESLDSIWERFDNRCVVCSAPKAFLERLGIGRQVHHVAPYAQEEHCGPLVSICTHCHETATQRQRVFWYFQRVIAADENSRAKGGVKDVNRNVA